MITVSSRTLPKCKVEKYVFFPLLVNSKGKGNSRANLNHRFPSLPSTLFSWVISVTLCLVLYHHGNCKSIQGIECFPTLSAEVIHTCVFHTTAQLSRVPEVTSSRGHMVTGRCQTLLHVHRQMYFARHILFNISTAIAIDS